MNGIGKDAVNRIWKIYRDNAPEMKPIVEVLKRHQKEEEVSNG